MAHAQKPDFVLRRNGGVLLNLRGRQFSRLLAAEVCASAFIVGTVLMLGTPCPEVVWKEVATHSNRQFPLHFPSRASPFAITFQLGSTVQATLKPGRLPLEWALGRFRKSLCVCVCVCECVDACNGNCSCHSDAERCLWHLAMGTNLNCKYILRTQEWMPSAHRCLIAQQARQCEHNVTILTLPLFCP
jgi:hypothetical protein